MRLDRFQPSSSKSTPGSRPLDPPLASRAKRAKTLPAHLPSNPAPRAEAKPERKPITRAQPDAHPPENFSGPPVRVPKLFGVPLRTEPEVKQANEERIMEGAARKAHALRDITDSKGYVVDLREYPEYRDVVLAYHPRFAEYSPEKQANAIKMLINNPRYLAEMAQSRNEVSRLPNGPTATRKMEPEEQKFLTNGIRRIQEDIREKPFHIHGESAVIGNKEGEVTSFGHNPAGLITTDVQSGDKDHLHTHPPFQEPFTSSASSDDQKAAAIIYRAFDNKMSAYVTNGRDVLHIQPDSTELVRLIPDPDAEKELGKFPLAFRLPTPQPLPHPFTNHESPAAFKPWVPPAKPEQP
jgi:hypothetical protein